jgi:hypothetical protein
MLMSSVIVLALVHAVLSILVLYKQDTISSDNLKMFLYVSVVVCLIIAGLAGYCCMQQD